jgi:hypothetical protein
MGRGRHRSVGAGHKQCDNSRPAVINDARCVLPHSTPTQRAAVSTLRPDLTRERLVGPPQLELSIVTISLAWLRLQCHGGADPLRQVTISAPAIHLLLRRLKPSKSNLYEQMNLVRVPCMARTDAASRLPARRSHTAIAVPAPASSPASLEWPACAVVSHRYRHLVTGTVVTSARVAWACAATLLSASCVRSRHLALRRQRWLPATWRSWLVAARASVVRQHFERRISPKSSR